MPPELSDRMIEGCEPLVAIADLMGHGAAARNALVKVLTVERLDNIETRRVKLLRDIKAVWDDREQRRGKLVTGIPTESLLRALASIEESGWDNYYGHGAMQPNALASLLRHYGVKSRNLKLSDGSVKKGYRRDDLHPVFDRYLR